MMPTNNSGNRTSRRNAPQTPSANVPMNGAPHTPNYGQPTSNGGGVWYSNTDRPSSAVPTQGQVRATNHPLQAITGRHRAVKPEPKPVQDDRFSAVAPLQIKEPVTPKPPRKPWKPGPKLLQALKYVIPVLVIVLLIVVGSAVAGNVRKAREHREMVESVTSFDQRFCYGVYVDGIHLGGMTQQEAVSAVSNQAAQALSAWNVQLTFQGQTVVVLNAANLGMSVDISEAMNNAWAQGHTGSVAERRAEMDSLQETPFQTYTV